MIPKGVTGNQLACKTVQVRGLSQKFVDNMDNFEHTRGKSIIILLLFCPLY